MYTLPGSTYNAMWGGGGCKDNYANTLQNCQCVPCKSPRPEECPPATQPHQEADLTDTGIQPEHSTPNTGQIPTNSNQEYFPTLCTLV
jgi:hypothetical protein